jgi:hypothetical protein
MQDSHVYAGNARAVENGRGFFAPPITVASIEGQTVITALPGAEIAQAFKLKIGDIVIAIDGVPVEERRARLATLVSASTPQALRKVVDSQLLRGSKDSAARLLLRDPSDMVREVEVPRSAPWASVGFARPRTAPSVDEILPSGYGYIDLARLRLEDADRAMDAVLDAPALIFDMRGYPDRTLWPIAPRLAAEDKVIVGAIQAPLLDRRKFEPGSRSTDPFIHPDPSIDHQVALPRQGCDAHK